MRISILGMAAVIFFANIASAQIQSASFRFAISPTIQPNLAGLTAPVGGAPATLDDTKKNWQRLAETIGEKPFIVDYASFIAKDDLTFIEFYIQISYNRLRFARAGKFYQAIYNIDFYLQDAAGNLVQTLSARDTVRTNDYAVTGAANNFRITLLNSCLPPADYKLRAIITDNEFGQSY